MVDIEVIETRLKMLGEYVKDLGQFKKITFNEYQDKKIIQRFVERTLQLAVQVCLDVGSHIISLQGFREPENNKDVFKVLHEEGILSAKFSQQLAKMAQFRNLLIHDYAKIDHGIVYGILKRQLPDFNRYSKLIHKYAEEKISS